MGDGSSPGRVKVVQQQVGNEGRNDDGQRGGEAFQDVVCVFNDHGYDQASQRLRTEEGVFDNKLKTNTTKKKEQERRFDTTCSTTTVQVTAL